MNKHSLIYIAGHNGLVGGALWRKLWKQGYTNLVGTSHKELDLTDADAVMRAFEATKPQYVFLAAAKVGGIHANDVMPAEFIYDNLAIQTNIISACHEHNVKKLMFLGSVCIYPKYAPVPVKEESLLTGELEPTNQWYAIAKIAGIKMCQAYRKQYKDDYISVMPCNLYGVGDNFHPTYSHVIPGLVHRFMEAKKRGDKTVTCWGTGEARREFLYVDDMADACIFLMNNYSQEQIINIGFGQDYTIKELVEQIADITEYNGDIAWDTSKPDGTPKRMLDSSRLFDLGWKPKVSLREGLTRTISWYILQQQNKKDGN